MGDGRKSEKVGPASSFWENDVAVVAVVAVEISDPVVSCAIADVVAGLAMFVYRRARGAGRGCVDSVGAGLETFDAWEGPKDGALYAGRVGVLESMFVDVLQGDDGDDDGDNDGEEVLVFLLHECLATCGEACMTESGATGAILLAMSRANQRLGAYKTGSTAALARGHDKLPAPVEVDRDRMHMASFDALACGSTAGDEEFERFATGASSVRHPEAWLAMLASSSTDPDRLERLGELYVRDQLASRTSQAACAAVGTVASCLANSLWLNVGADSARRFYDAVLKGPLPGAGFIIEAARMELRLGRGTGTSRVDGIAAIERVRNIYRAGISVYGHSAELWLAYYAFERSLGGDAVSKADDVAWRATQMVPGFSALAAK